MQSCQIRFIESRLGRDGFQIGADVGELRVDRHFLYRVDEKDEFDIRNVPKIFISTAAH